MGDFPLQTSRDGELSAYPAACSSLADSRPGWEVFLYLRTSIF